TEPSAWCNCQAIPGSQNYPGPWHERGGEKHYPCAKTATATVEDVARVVVLSVLDDDERSNYVDTDALAPTIVKALADAGLLATARTRPTRDDISDALGFHIEERAGVPVLVWSQGGCQPATTAERAMWSHLLATARARPTREQIARAIGNA